MRCDFKEEDSIIVDVDMSLTAKDQTPRKRLVIRKLDTAADTLVANK